MCTACSYPGRLRPRGSKCATRTLAAKLHLGLPTCALRASGQLITSHESTRPQATPVLCCRRLPRGSYSFAKPNYLALLLSRQSPSGDAVEEQGLRIVIWLILPVVICLSQRLSHACLSISIIQRNCEWLIKTVIVYLIIEFTWITVVILELIHAGMLDFCGRAVFIR